MFKINTKHLFLKYNFLVLFFIFFTAFIVIVGLFKFFYSKPTYLYIKVKVGQGLWWAATQKPEFWFVKSIKKGEKELDLRGKPQSEILGLSSYPVLTENSYSRFDIFVDIRIKTSFDKRNNRYIFKRDVVSVGSPIEFQFPSVNITGTVIDMSNKPIQSKYIEKIVYLYSFGGYKKDFTYLWDNLIVGDKYFDGKEIVFQVIDKQLIESIRIYEQQNDVVQHILVKARIKLLQKEGEFFYGEERPIKIGDNAPFLTNDFNFETFSIVKIE